ncbi:MAG: cell division protein, partial [Corynebacterium sp.]|nr:cell division protein [Corynebacterium sp.]
MAEQKQGGLGKGLAALIPSGPDAPTRKPRLGDSAADIILGNSTPQPGRKGGEGKRVKGAPTIQQGSGSKSSKKRQATPAPIGATYREISIGDIIPNPKQPRT